MVVFIERSLRMVKLYLLTRDNLPRDQHVFRGRYKSPEVTHLSVSADLEDLAEAAAANPF